LNDKTASARPKSIPVVVDIPTDVPRLGFHKYVDGIAAAIVGGHPARYTVGIYGPWGSGKSTLLGAVAQKLQSDFTALGEEVAPIVVRFDAWRYQKADELIFPLLESVESSITKANEQRKNAHLASLAKKIRSFVGALEVSFMGVSARWEKGEDAPAKDERYWSPFKALEQLGVGGPAETPRIVVMVDDLDRCTPDGVVNVLEAIHVLTDIEGFVFVVALDREYLTKAIMQKYREDRPAAERFIEKIVQIPFSIPQRRVTGAVLNEIVKDWDTANGLREQWFGPDSEAVLETIVTVALRSNPRQVKRLINLYLLIRHMEWESTADTSLLLRVLGLQLALPTDYVRLGWSIDQALAEAESEADQGSLLLRDVPEYTDWVADAENDDDDGSMNAPSRAAYAKSVLTGDLNVVALQRLFSLTNAINDAEVDELTALQATMAEMQPAAQTLFEDLLQSALGRADDVVSRDVKNYVSVRRMDTRLPKGKIFVSLVPRRGKVLVFLPWADGHFMTSPIAVRDLRGKGHQGHGDVEVTVMPGDGSIEAVKRMIAEAYDLVADD